MKEKCHMARIKGVQVSATVSKELNAALEDHRWMVRKTKAEVVLAAIEEYAANHGLEVAYADTDSLHTPDEAPAPENVV
jgi:post-segregation antitoxin (ccd killing protein)